MTENVHRLRVAEQFAMSDKDEDLFGSDADLDDVIGDAKPATATRNDEEEDLFGSDDEPEPVAEQDLGTKASRFNTGRTATQKLLGPAKVVFKPQDSIRISSPGIWLL
uniref:Uncharacterized protein n=1 Tax=Spongospora subterranea TaxID=70186 RepID=A0A0H5QHV2_9EUKA|eukprot:CRZ01625.1 hypothetical protein [Spongospora subterranea]